ncbi:MAG: hypothetical protein IPM35_23965 [Myxococcales bacterium]|nr:hypothetical protein [Myxococcales bacterium]
MAGRTAFTTLAALLAALLACGGQGDQIARRYERAGASPPLDGPRALGPVAKKGSGTLQVGATTARVETQGQSVEDDAPANVASRAMFHAGYFHGVTPGLELGGALMVTHTGFGKRLSSDTPSDRLEDTLFFGSAFSLRGVLAEDEVFFLVGTTELSFWILPYHERVSESEDGSPFVFKDEKSTQFEYFQLRGGLSAGIRVGPLLSVAGGALLQGYPVFQSTTEVATCDPDCRADGEEPTVFGSATTPFVWASFTPGRLSLSAQWFANVGATHHLSAAMPYGGTLALGYRLGQ